jgi:hypothetical protein
MTVIQKNRITETKIYSSATFTPKFPKEKIVLYSVNQIKHIKRIGVDSEFNNAKVATTYGIVSIAPERMLK